MSEKSVFVNVFFGDSKSPRVSFTYFLTTENLCTITADRNYHRASTASLKRLAAVVSTNHKKARYMVYYNGWKVDIPR